MAIVVAERADSRPNTSGENPTVDLEYVIIGTESDVDADNALLGEAPATYRSLVRQSTSLEHAGYMIWYGTVRYGKLAPREVGDYTFNFDTTGWGWIHLLLGLLLILVGYFLYTGAAWAVVTAIVLAGLSAISNFFFIPYYPFWSIVLIGLDVWVIWALTRPGVVVRA